MYKEYVLALFLLCVAGTGQALAESPALSFTAQPDQDEAILTKRFSGLATYLSGKLGIPVKYVPARSYHWMVKAFIRNDVQFAWLGGYTGLQARQGAPGSEAIAQTPQDAHFKSYFIANVSAGLTPSNELPYILRGKTFTFGAPNSTSGRLMPEYFIRKRFGTGPKDVFSRVGFTGDHGATLQQVQSGEVQVGAIDSLVYERKKSEGAVDETKVTVIWKSPEYTNNQFSVRGDVDEAFGSGFKGKLKQAILDCNDQDILKYFGGVKFISSDNSQYKAIEEVAQLVKLTD